MRRLKKLSGLKSLKRRVSNANRKLKELKNKEQLLQKNLTQLKKLMRKRGLL